MYIYLYVFLNRKLVIISEKIIWKKSFRTLELNNS